MLCCALFSACSNDDIANAPEEEETPMISVIVPDKVLYVDEETEGPGTRSTLAYDKVNKKMIFTWDSTDAIGMFNVSDENSDNTRFQFKETVSNTESSSTAKFYNDNFSFDNEKFWVAYSPYLPAGVKPLTRDAIDITYRGQTALSNGTPNGLKPSTNSTMESEALASSHLGAYDYLVSEPVKPNPDGITTFPFKHVGSTMRLYMQFPEGAFGGAGKTGKVKSLRVLTPKENLLVSDAKLSINQNPTGEGASYSVASTTPTNSLELKFKGEDGTGIVVPDNGFLISYMEFFPTNIPAESALLHLTIEVDGVEKYFTSKWMTAVNIGSGYIYQWTAKQYNEIIELTATIQPWNEIVGSGISTDIEK